MQGASGSEPVAYSLVMKMDSQENDENVLTNTHAGDVDGRGEGTEWDGGSLGTLMQNVKEKPAGWGGGGSGGQQAGEGMSGGLGAPLRPSRSLCLFLWG